MSDDVLAVLFVLAPFVFLFSISYLFRKWVKRNANKKAFKIYDSIFDVQPVFKFIYRKAMNALDGLLMKLFVKKKSIK